MTEWRLGVEGPAPTSNVIEERGEEKSTGVADMEYYE
jgi:hypothetical protein